MTSEVSKPPATIENLSFDEFGRYEITEIIGDEELDLISGGASNGICPNLPGCVPNPNIYCPTPPPPPPPPPPNKTCGEDGDGE